MNDAFSAWGIESWKPILFAIVAPPVPLIAIIAFGGYAIWRRRRFGLPLTLLGCAALWLSLAPATGDILARYLLDESPALTAADIAGLVGASDTAIVVLGRGRRLIAPEYGDSELTAGSIERLRYGIWLARATQLPVAFSGGVGWGAAVGPTEADIAARTAERDFGFQLKWVERDSSDTHQNAVNTVALLRPAEIRRIVLVTDSGDMPRAVRNFERASAELGWQIVPAPAGSSTGDTRYTALDWVPSPRGYERVFTTLHEWLGQLARA